MALEIFRQTGIPRHHRNHPISQHASWFTWSPWARSVFDELRGELEIGRPVVRTVRACEPYGRTYHLDTSQRGDHVRTALAAVARALMRFRPGSRIAFLHDLFTQVLRSAQLHRLFALLRCSLVEAASDDRVSLYSPAEPARGRNNDFALHADLFVVDRLLLVFDDVPDDDSGGSTFLPRAAFLDVLDRTRTMPASVRTSIAKLLVGAVERDSFNRLYSSLHGEHAWRDELAAALDRRKFLIRLRQGEGYLLNDRHWLHGRAAVSRPVGRRRFRRLVFGALPEPNAASRRRAAPSSR